MDRSVELAVLLKELRKELSEAMRRVRTRTCGSSWDRWSWNRPWRWNAPAGRPRTLRFWVVEVGGDAKVLAASTQRIKRY